MKKEGWDIKLVMTHFRIIFKSVPVRAKQIQNMRGNETYNVILRHVHKATVAVEKQYISHISLYVHVQESACLSMCACRCGCTGMYFHACSITYSGCNVHVPHCL
jgi:hypothetical protein